MAKLFNPYVLAILVGIGFYTSALSQLVYPNVYVQFDSAWIYKKLQLIPIRYRYEAHFPNNIPNNCISLKQAMEMGKIEVKEFFFNGDANVHVLSVKNKSNQPIVLKNGELLKGGKQDRMIAETKIIAPKSDNNFIEVYCVEQGRWDKKVQSFSYIGVADAWLQKTMDVTHQQQQVWKEIEHRLGNASKSNSTMPYLQAYNDSAAAVEEYTKFFVQKLKQSDSLFAGFIAITDTNIINCQVFAHPSLTIASWSGLTQNWIHAALVKGNTPQLPTKKVAVFTDDLFTNDEKQKLFLQQHGKMYFYNQQPFYLIAYP